MLFFCRFGAGWKVSRRAAMFRAFLNSEEMVDHVFVPYGDRLVLHRRRPKGV